MLLKKFEKEREEKAKGKIMPRRDVCPCFLKDNRFLGCEVVT